MYSILLTLHNATRWLVLIALLSSIGIAVTGLRQRLPPAPPRKFTAAANAWRHWTATVTHIQLLLGMILYLQSPIVKYPVPGDPAHLVDQHIFFRYIHITLMFVAVILITIGSAKAKRMPDDRIKYRTMLVWFAAGLLVLLIAIPWPFSPLAARPLIRKY